MEWHRWNGIEIIDKPNYTKRPYMYELPVLRQDLSNYLSYSHGDELAVSLFLSDMGAYLRRLKELYPENPDDPYPEYYELLAKRLPWFVKHLCERTDMVECGVPLRVGITNDIRDAVMPYLEASQFPMDAINWFDNRDAEYRWAAKYDAIRYPSLRAAKRVLHFDLSFLIGTNPAQYRIPLFGKILRSWENEMIASASSKLFHYRGEASAIQMSRGEEIARENNHIKPEDHPIWNAISSAYGESVEDVFRCFTETNPFLHIPGGVIGYSRKFLDDRSMQDRFDCILKEANNDEAVLDVIAYYESWDVSDIAIIHDAFPWCGYPYRIDPYCEFRFCTCEEQMDSDLFLGMHY